jgi:hypothetical protein
MNDQLATLRNFKEEQQELEKKLYDLHYEFQNETCTKTILTRRLFSPEGC